MTDHINTHNKETRHILINSPQIRPYADNTIKSAKYNFLNFLPLAIIYQFNNYFNIFFLVTAVILAIKEISPMDPGTAIAPFIFVIAVSVVREGIEDWKKSNFDKLYNNSITTKISKENNKEEKVKWSEVQVGNILKIQKNESIPSDLLIIKSSLTSGFCYMETTNLDGESALKPREALPIFTNLLKYSDQELQINNLKGELETDQPNNCIYNINGKISLINPETNQNLPETFFDINNILLRGTTLKNVEYAYGLVIYTGIDTKIMKNITTFSNKSSSIERTLNKVVIVVIIIVFSICVACTMFGMIFMGANVPSQEENLIRSEYIYFNSSENYPYTLEFFKLFGAFFIIFNNIIPISLTITFEIAKGIQVHIMGKDKEMYDENKDEKFKILSLKIQEDLGNVKYIFTDKTGTLTKNEMIFRACSIYSKLFFDNNENDEIYSNKEEILYENENEINVNENNNKKYSGIFSPLFNLNQITNAINCDLPIELEDIQDSYYKSTRDSVIEFFLNIALNHNVLTELDPVTNKVNYQGANPDEVSLVIAAKEIGIEFVKREGALITVKIDDHEYIFEVLHKFEFSSERARSSIIVKDLQTQETKLFIKGSDDKILKILDNFSRKNLENVTKEHLDKFAKSGLRTLCYAVKVINEIEYEIWNKKYLEIKYECLIDKNKKIELENQISKIESNCILLGVSGLEDKLQDEVKETISQLLEAGIQIWMVTGDKLDTAESIGYSSKLFDEDTEVFKIKNSSEKQEILLNMNRILEEINNMEKQFNQTKLERKKKKKKNRNKIKNLINNNNNNKSDENVIPSNEELIPNDLDIVCNPKINKQEENNININSKEIILHKKNSSNQNLPILTNPSNHHRYERSSRTNYHHTLQHKRNSNFQKINQSDENEILENEYNFTEHPSYLDDVSVFKFMLDKNFFDDSLMNKKEFAHTFMNKILQFANSQSGSIFKKSQEVINSYRVANSKNYIHDNINLSKIKINKEQHMEIRVNDRNNIEIINTELHMKKESEEVEEIDLSNLYEHYMKELDKMQQRKNSVRKIFKFTNFDFHNFRKKKTEEEEHDMKDVNLLNFGLVIEGNAITHCLDEELKLTFWKLIKKSRGIICCRCTPIQKSDIVNFVKSKSGEVCLAIGDGGNDVNMIKAANVGVGIFGKEGYQAAYNSDYAIAQFKYLKRLMFYHGRYSLLRNSYFIYFFFYKSLIFNMPNLWFSFFSGFSGTLIWDNLYFICYTSILSTVPPVVVMVWEEDIDITFEGDPNREILINLVPDIYKEYRDSSPFNSLKFFIIFISGIIHSAVIYFFPLFVFRLGLQDHTGRTHTLWDQSLLGVLTVLFVQYYIILQDTFLYSTPVIITHSVQIIINVLFFVLYALGGDDQLGAYTFDIISNLQFWFVFIITLTIDLLFVILSRKVEILFADTIINNLRNRKYEYDYTKKIYLKKLEHMSKCTRSLAKFKKIYKEIDKYEADNFADRKMKDFVEMYLKNKKDLKINSRFNSPDKLKKSKTVENISEKLKTLNIKIKQMKKKNSNLTLGSGKGRNLPNHHRTNRKENVVNYNLNLNVNVINNTNNNVIENNKSNLKSNNISEKSNITLNINNNIESNSKSDYDVPVENEFDNTNNNLGQIINKNNKIFTEEEFSESSKNDFDRNLEIIDDIETKIIFFDPVVHNLKENN